MKRNGAFFVGLVTALATLHGVHAQTQAADQNIPVTNLSGDRGPEQPHPGAAFVPFAGGGPPPWERGPLARGPSLSVALKAAEAAIAACDAEAHMPIAVSVVDSIGQPRAQLAADGRRGWHIYNATRKALTAIGFGEPTSKAAADAATTAGAAKLKANMSTLPGAVPLLAGSAVIGAIGVSGTKTGAQDEKCAAAGAAAVTDQLK